MDRREVLKSEQSEKTRKQPKIYIKDRPKERTTCECAMKMMKRQSREQRQRSIAVLQKKITIYRINAQCACGTRKKNEKKKTIIT